MLHQWLFIECIFGEIICFFNQNSSRNPSRIPLHSAYQITNVTRFFLVKADVSGVNKDFLGILICIPIRQVDDFAYLVHFFSFMSLNHHKISILIQNYDKSTFQVVSIMLGFNWASLYSSKVETTFKNGNLFLMPIGM